MCGSARCTQSDDEPSRTKSALVKAANDMVMAKMATQTPLREAPSAAVPALTTGAALGSAPRLRLVCSLLSTYFETPACVLRKSC